MNKINIDINFPLIQKSINVNIPINKKVGEVLIQIIENYEELSAYTKKKTYAIFDGESGDYLNYDILVKDSVLKNGSYVIII